MLRVICRPVLIRTQAHLVFGQTNQILQIMKTPRLRLQNGVTVCILPPDILITMVILICRPAAWVSAHHLVMLQTLKMLQLQSMIPVLVCNLVWDKPSTKVILILRGVFLPVWNHSFMPKIPEILTSAATTQKVWPLQPQMHRLLTKTPLPSQRVKMVCITMVCMVLTVC